MAAHASGPPSGAVAVSAAVESQSPATRGVWPWSIEQPAHEGTLAGLHDVPGS